MACTAIRHALRITKTNRGGHDRWRPPEIAAPIQADFISVSWFFLDRAERKWERVAVLPTSFLRGLSKIQFNSAGRWTDLDRPELRKKCSRQCDPAHQED